MLALEICLVVVVIGLAILGARPGEYVLDATEAAAECATARGATGS
jgi:hypothetical protein